MVLNSISPSFKGAIIATNTGRQPNTVIAPILCQASFRTSCNLGGVEYHIFKPQDKDVETACVDALKQSRQKHLHIDTNYISHVYGADKVEKMAKIYYELIK